MRRFVWAQLRVRAGRTVALGLAILVAATGFTVLTASSSASRLQTVGTVRAHARTTYDLLVRPRDSRTRLETSQRLVQPGFLAGLHGGITMDQWRRIQGLPGIHVAAPIAMVGTVVAEVPFLVDMESALPEHGDGVARTDAVWSFDNGLSHETQSPNFTYLTTKELRENLGAVNTRHRSPQNVGDWVMRAGDADRDVCASRTVENGDRIEKPVESAPSTIDCFSRSGSGAYDIYPSGSPVKEVDFPVRYVLAAVDPVQEARLDGLDDALVSGRYLTGAPLTDPHTVGNRAVPVLAASRQTSDLSASVTVSRVGGNATGKVRAGMYADALRTERSVAVANHRFTAQQAYAAFLEKLRHPHRRYLWTGNVRQYFSVSSPRYARTAGDAWTPTGQPPLSPEEWNTYVWGAPLPAGTNDTPVRATTSHQIVEGTMKDSPPAIVLRGTFDASRLRGLSDLTAQILGGHTPARADGGDARSRRLLANRPLAPSPNVGGFVQPPPTMITSLDALPQLVGAAWSAPVSGAPISAIRVRVAGVTGVDPVSRERVRVAAQRIQRATGLDVDVTVGASATRERIDLPAGRYGRPSLELSQWWVEKGVAVAIIKAVDRKSVILFVLVLLVCALSVANAAIASVRGRREELGVLACIGWGPRHLFTGVALELGVVAVAAGLLAAGAALGVGLLIGTPVGVARAALAVPAALVVALTAGLVPALLAARSDPMDAVRPAVRLGRRARSTNGVLGLGMVNLSRNAGRSVLAVGGLLVAVAAFTVLLGITLAFQGTVVGTILGDVVAVQARGADYAATVATLVLAGLGVANVLFLNVRDRGSELATLRAIGWPDVRLTQLVVVEAVGIGATGSVAGAVVGLVTTLFLTGRPAGGVVAAAAVAVATGMLVAVAASVVPAVLLRRLPTTLLLTEEG